jgi:hypothetical protein
VFGLPWLLRVIEDIGYDRINRETGRKPTKSLDDREMAEATY